jgi:hypothetical protein
MRIDGSDKYSCKRVDWKRRALAAEKARPALFFLLSDLDLSPEHRATLDEVLKWKSVRDARDAMEATR